MAKILVWEWLLFGVAGGSTGLDGRRLDTSRLWRLDKSLL